MKMPVVFSQKTAEQFLYKKMWDYWCSGLTIMYPFATSHW
jgi:hypothetical protein